MEKKYHLFNDLSNVPADLVGVSYDNLQLIIDDFNTFSNTICTVYINTTTSPNITTPVSINIDSSIKQDVKFNFIGKSKFISVLPDLKIVDFYIKSAKIELNYESVKIGGVEFLNTKSDVLVYNDESLNPKKLPFQSSSYLDYPSIKLNTVNCEFANLAKIKIKSSFYVPNFYFKSTTSLITNILIDQNLDTNVQQIFIEEATGSLSELKTFSSNKNFVYKFSNLDLKETNSIIIDKSDNLNSPSVTLFNCKNFDVQIYSSSTIFDPSKSNPLSINGGNGTVYVATANANVSLAKNTDLNFTMELPDTLSIPQRLFFRSDNSKITTLAVSANYPLSISDIDMQKTQINGSFDFSSIALLTSTKINLVECSGTLKIPANSTKYIFPEFSVYDSNFPSVQSVRRPLSKVIYDIDFMSNTVATQLNRFTIIGGVSIPLTLSDFGDQEIRLTASAILNAQAGFYTKRGFRISKNTELHKITTLYRGVGSETLLVGSTPSSSALLCIAGIGTNPTGTSAVNVTGVFDTYIGFRYQQNKNNGNFVAWHSRFGFIKPGVNGLDTGVPYPAVGEAYDFITTYDSINGNATFKIIDRKKGLLFESSIDNSGMTSPSGNELYFGIDKVISTGNTFIPQIQLLDSKLIRYTN